MHPLVVQIPPLAHGFGKQLSRVAIVDAEIALIVREKNKKLESKQFLSQINRKKVKISLILVVGH